MLPVRYETIRTHKVEHMLGGFAPSRAEAIEEGVRLSGQSRQDRSQCDVVGIIKELWRRCPMAETVPARVRR